MAEQPLRDETVLITYTARHHDKNKDAKIHNQEKFKSEELDLREYAWIWVKKKILGSVWQKKKRKEKERKNFSEILKAEKIK